MQRIRYVKLFLVVAAILALAACAIMLLWQTNAAPSGGAKLVLGAKEAAICL